MCCRPPTPRDGVAVRELGLQQEEEKQALGLRCVEINHIIEENNMNIMPDFTSVHFFSQM